jgi:glyoxylase-like metal-dependent hydrolase (beta-lactamase superfamily II)
VRVTRIVESETKLPATDLFPQASAEAMAPHHAWLVPHFMDAEDQIRLSIHALVVDTPGLRVLVDTCIGEHSLPGYEDLSENSADLREELAAAGVPLESVDVVLCTHLHFDHVGWNTVRVDGRWVPTFPNARYLFARTEWEHWSAEPEAGFASTLESAVRPVVDAGLADLVESDHRLCESLRLVPTPGHTPGHVALVIESEGARALITGDCTHHPVQWAEPDWTMSADTDSAEAAVTRRTLIEAHGDAETLIIGTHYAGPTAGHIVRVAGGWQFRARL